MVCWDLAASPGKVDDVTGAFVDTSGCQAIPICGTPLQDHRAVRQEEELPPTQVGTELIWTVPRTDSRPCSLPRLGDRLPGEVRVCAAGSESLPGHPEACTALVSCHWYRSGHPACTWKPCDYRSGLVSSGW